MEQKKQLGNRKKILSLFHKENLIQFLMKISYEVIDSTPELIFNADETMLSGKRLYKAITENNRAIT